MNLGNMKNVAEVNLGQPLGLSQNAARDSALQPEFRHRRNPPKGCSLFLKDVERA